MTDDMGYADVGSYGASDIRTPNIDSLARDGIRLTDFYSNGGCARRRVPDSSPAAIPSGTAWSYRRSATRGR